MSPDNTISSPEQPRVNIDEIKWISQHDLPSPLKAFSKHFCGIACISMVTNKPIDEVLRKAAEITVLPTTDKGEAVPENQWIIVPHPTGDIKIALGPSTWIDRYPEAASFPRTEIPRVEGARRVTPFNLRGLMHDSTEELVAALDVGLTAKKVDNPKVDELLASGEVLLASVKNDPWMYEGAKGTHVILVAGQENDSYKIFDPNSNTPGPQLVPKEKFAAAFNHYGTAIKY